MTKLSKLLESMPPISQRYNKPLTAEEVPAAKESIKRLEGYIAGATQENCCGTAYLRLTKRLRLAKEQLQRWETT